MQDKGLVEIADQVSVFLVENTFNGVAALVSWSGRMIRHPYALPVATTNLFCFMILNKLSQQINPEVDSSKIHKTFRHLFAATVVGTAIYGLNTLLSQGSWKTSPGTRLILATTAFVVRLILSDSKKPKPPNPHFAFCELSRSTIRKPKGPKPSGFSPFTLCKFNLIFQNMLDSMRQRIHRIVYQRTRIMQ